MLVQELINLINLEADELLDSDAENIPYINAAIDFLSLKLKDYIKPLIVTDNLPLPSDYISLSPSNGYPVRIENDNVFRLISGTSANVRYIAYRPHVSQVNDTLPFRNVYGTCLLMISSYLIKKKGYIPAEYTTQDKSFVADLMAAIQEAKGG